MNDSESDLEECVPIKTDVCHNLAAEEVYDLLVHASGKYKDSSSCATRGWYRFSVQFG